MSFSNISFIRHARVGSTGATLAFLGLLSVPAAAADLEAEDTSAIPPVQNFDTGRFGGVRQRLAGWNVVVGAGAMYAPKFEGSDEFEVSPFPMISATFGERVSVDPSGVTVDVLQSDGFKLSVKGGYEMGRKEDDSDHLRGLGDIDAGGVIGGQVSYAFGPADIYASVDKTFGGSEGLVGKVGANVSHQYDRFIFSAGASATIADDNHMESYFGVSAAQSARSGFNEYEASAGLKRVDVEASVTYMASENWLIRGQVGVGLLTGDAADSPIVQDDIQPSGMLMVGYKF